MEFKYNELIKTLKDIELISKKIGPKIPFISSNIEDLGCPHEIPKKLPSNMAAIYIFIYKNDNECLKIGKVNEKTSRRFTTGHYRLDDDSTVAKSLCTDEKFTKLNVNRDNVENWMKENLQRINIYYPANRAVTELVEAILHYKFRPRFEGSLYPNKK